MNIELIFEKFFITMRARTLTRYDFQGQTKTLVKTAGTEDFSNKPTTVHRTPITKQ
jgi:hypothetical protein